MSTNRFTTPELTGRTVYCRDGDKLGTVEGVLEDETGMPRYLEITSGWFGTRRHAVPLDGLMLRDDGDDLTIPYTKDEMKNAPTLDERDEMTYEHERHMGSHYGHDVREWDDTRDRWLPEEDLSRGPTPQTRHPYGGRDLEADTSQGPTPEVRGALRAGDADHPDDLRTTGGAGMPVGDRDTAELDRGHTIPRRDERDLRDDRMRDDLRARDDRTGDDPALRDEGIRDDLRTHEERDRLDDRTLRDDRMRDDLRTPDERGLRDDMPLRDDRMRDDLRTRDEQGLRDDMPPREDRMRDDLRTPDEQGLRDDMPLREEVRRRLRRRRGDEIDPR